MNSHFLGRAGEHAVAAQLLAREIQVHFPAVDTGVDLIAGGCVRIQVKSSVRKRNMTTYAFSLRGGPKPNGGVRVHKNWSKEADFLVFWGMDENRFWIVPSALLAPPKNVQTLLLGSTHQRQKIDHEKIRELYASGVRQCDLAAMFSVTPKTISDTVLRQKEWAFGVSGECNKFENAWHEIESAIRLAEQIDTEIPTTIRTEQEKI